jgi:hypothetical protein
MGAGTGTVVFDNRDGVFDRDNPSSPFYPNLRPARRFRLYAIVPSPGTAFTIGQSAIGGGDAWAAGSNAYIPLFLGRTEGGPMEFVENADSYVAWSLVDSSKLLNRDRSLTGYGSGAVLTGTRVNEVLNGTTPFWLDGREITPGLRTVQQEDGLLGRYDYLVQVAESEGGVFFIGADGRAIFRGADYAPDADIIFGDVEGEERYKAIKFDDDDTEIYNTITVSAPALADQIRQDTASQAEYGRADLPISSLLSTTSEMADLAASVRDTYSVPSRRVGSLRIGSPTSSWNEILRKEIGDRVLVRNRPIYGGTIEQESVIQGISLDVPSLKDWNIVFNLSPPLEVVSNPNLLTENQASMETDTSGWALATVSPPGSFSIVGLAGGSVPFLGSFCLECSSSGGGEVYGGVRTTPYTTVPVTVGQTYRVSGWTRSYFGTVEPFVYIEFWTSGGSLLTFQYGAAQGFSTEWVYAEKEMTAPVNAAYAGVQMQVHEWDAPHPVYFDAVSLRHVAT